jgi:hypothetical protein
MCHVNNKSLSEFGQNIRSINVNENDLVSITLVIHMYWKQEIWGKKLEASNDGNPNSTQYFETQSAQNNIACVLSINKNY